MIVADAAAFRGWLDANRDRSEGVWLVLAKKGMTDPTSLTYAQALEESLCQGWIDGQKRSRDATTFAERFSPRRRTSQWSKRNLRIAEELIAADRMLPAGLAEIDRAKADGRWAAAYSGQADASVPADLAAALSANPCCGEDVRRPERRQPVRGVVPHRNGEACRDSLSSDRSIRRDAGSRRNDPSPATCPTEIALSCSTAHGLTVAGANRRCESFDRFTHLARTLAIGQYGWMRRVCVLVRSATGLMLATGDACCSAASRWGGGRILGIGIGPVQHRRQLGALAPGRWLA